MRLSLWSETWLDLRRITVWLLADSSLRFLSMETLRKTEGLSDIQIHQTTSPPLGKLGCALAEQWKTYTVCIILQCSEQMNQLNCSKGFTEYLCIRIWKEGLCDFGSETDPYCRTCNSLTTNGTSCMCVYIKTCLCINLLLSYIPHRGIYL